MQVMEKNVDPEVTLLAFLRRSWILLIDSLKHAYACLTDLKNLNHCGCTGDCALPSPLALACHLLLAVARRISD